MEQTLKRSINFNTKVTAMEEVQDGKYVAITVEDENGNVTKVPTDFSIVISTPPLARLSVMDLSGVDLSYAQWNSIRELQYNIAVKVNRITNFRLTRLDGGLIIALQVGIRFSKNWWADLPNPIVGGVSYTDLPIRTVVYPSYPANGTKSSVLMVSYCWMQDAQRLGALMNGDGTAKPELFDIVIRDLALMHGKNESELYELFDPTDTGNYFAWSWLQNPLTMGNVLLINIGFKLFRPFFRGLLICIITGSYAEFGPQQFSDQIYPAITQPAARGKLIFAGEATSSVHGYVFRSFID